jgi:hypothetical protein
MTDTIKAGKLEFLLEFRGERKDEDGGPTMRVLGPVDGKNVELLRFDMFRISPHYHYAPGGVNLRYSLDPVLLGDGISWVMDVISHKLPELLAKAGYPTLATPTTVAEIRKALPEIEALWRTQH